MNWTEKLNNTRSGLRTLNAAIPDTSKAFGALNAAVKQSGVLDYKPRNSLHWASRSRTAASPVSACISLP